MFSIERASSIRSSKLAKAEQQAGDRPDARRILASGRTHDDMASHTVGSERRLPRTKSSLLSFDLRQFLDSQDETLAGGNPAAMDLSSSARHTRSPPLVPMPAISEKSPTLPAISENGLPMHHTHSRGPAASSVWIDCQVGASTFLILSRPLPRPPSLTRSLPPPHTPRRPLPPSSSASTSTRPSSHNSAAPRGWRQSRRTRLRRTGFMYGWACA